MRGPGGQVNDRSPLDYEQLLRRCADKAYNFAYRLSGNEQDAHDLVQEAFLRGFEHRDRYDPSRPFEAWIIQILKNVFLDAMRRYERRHVVSLDAPTPTEREAAWEDILPGRDPLPVDKLMRDEDETLLHRALAQLPPHYRTAVILFDIEGFDYQQVSKIMGVPMGTVASRIHQGRALLKRILKSREAGKAVHDHE
jgi:RNA polymerase sigma-70 factor (ECF subfamily)